MTIIYIIFFLTIFAFLILLELIFRKKITERSIVRTTITCILWTVCYIIFKNIWIYFFAGLITNIITDLILISSLYPTPDHKIFGRKNAV